MDKNVKFRILFRGAIIAFLSALLGNLIFATVEDLRIIIRFGLDDSMFFLIFGLGLSLSAIPSLLFGLILANSIYRDFLKGTLRIANAILKGTILGLLIASGASLLILILLNGRGRFDLYLLRVFEATVIAILCGGYAGMNLAKHILSQQDAQR